MAHIRSIKPEALKDADLWDLEVETGLPIFRAFAGLWCQADREGRFKWKPRELKIEVLPFWDGDFGEVLDALARAGFVRRYEVDGRVYGHVRSFLDHQRPNAREAKSKIPPPPVDACTETHVHAGAEHPPKHTTHVTRGDPARGEGNKERNKEGNDASRARDAQEPRPELFHAAYQRVTGNTDLSPDPSQWRSWQLDAVRTMQEWARGTGAEHAAKVEAELRRLKAADAAGDGWLAKQGLGVWVKRLGVGAQPGSSVTASPEIFRAPAPPTEAEKAENAAAARDARARFQAARRPGGAPS
ncbi:MAG: hypothetical protein ACWGPR_11585 [Candidatus Deferrimicrobiaceae bacterium]